MSAEASDAPPLSALLAEVTQLRSELDQQRRMIADLAALRRAHIANVSLFNQESVRDQILAQLETLLPDRESSSAAS